MDPAAGGWLTSWMKTWEVMCDGKWVLIRHSCYTLGKAASKQHLRLVLRESSSQSVMFLWKVVELKSREKTGKETLRDFTEQGKTVSPDILGWWEPHSSLLPSSLFPSPYLPPCFPPSPPPPPPQISTDVLMKDCYKGEKKISGEKYLKGEEECHSTE